MYGSEFGIKFLGQVGLCFRDDNGVEIQGIYSYECDSSISLGGIRATSNTELLGNSMNTYALGSPCQMFPASC